MIRLSGFLWFLCAVSLYGQTHWEKIIKNPAAKEISVDLKWIQRLFVTTSASNELRLTTRSEGEYQNAVVVVVREENQWMEISPEFIPSFDVPNDKLSAHKIFAIDLHLILPENLTLEIVGNQGEVDVSGSYHELRLRLGSGKVFLTHDSEQSDIRTQSADIYLDIPDGEVEAKSEFGQVEGSITSSPIRHYVLNSVKGMIFLNQLTKDES